MKFYSKNEKTKRLLYNYKIQYTDR